MITFQLLSKDGSSLDDAEVLSGRWQAYVEGFVSEAETPGVPAAKVRRPFLRRYGTSHPPPPLSWSHIRKLTHIARYRNRSLPTSATSTTGDGNSGPSPGTDAGTRGPGAGQDFYARGGLEIKVCVRTYRLFYVSRTEDVLWRTPSAAETERANERLATRDEARARWFEKFTSTSSRSVTGGVGGVGSGGVASTSTSSEAVGLD